MAATDELERRVRTVEEELAGERHVSRYMVEQAVRNGEVLHAARSEVGAVTGRMDILGADMAAVKAALAMHGRALDVLQQDVRQLRSEVGELNRRLGKLDTEIGELNNRLGTDLGELNRKLDTEIGELNNRLDTELGEINRKLDVLIAAITPRSPV